jgi:hypothetical protein
VAKVMIGEIKNSDNLLQRFAGLANIVIEKLLLLIAFVTFPD